MLGRREVHVAEAGRTLDVSEAGNAQVTKPFAGNDRFDVIRSIGAGSFGTVYEVRDRVRSTRVALKVLSRPQPSHIEGFKNEFRSLANLRHPNLVALYELFCESDVWFFTMELVRGRTFVDYVRDHDGGPGSPDHDRFGRALRQLVIALSTLHLHGKLHRDVKPTNTLVTNEGRLVLLDFGLVASLDESSAGSVAGTPGYASPEQMAGRQLSPASDWFSVGAVLMEALAASPTSGDTDAGPSSHSKLFRLAERLLRIDPDGRPSSDEILSVLDGPEAGERIPSGSVPKRPSLLVGRDVEMNLLKEAAKRVQPGVPSVVLVRGPSGIGKSTLVSRFLLEVGDALPNALVLSGRCYEREHVPYKALDGIMDVLSRELAALPSLEQQQLLPDNAGTIPRLFPTLRRVAAFSRTKATAQFTDSQELRRHGFAEFRQLLKRVAATRPLVIAIDDLQWGDEDSASLLSEVLRGPDAPALLAILSFRADATPSNAFSDAFLPSADVLRSPTHVVHLPMAGLSDDAAITLTTALLNGNDHNSSLCRTIAAESKGNPLFLTELARSAAEQPAASPLRLEDAFAARVADVPADARELLELIAAYGGPIDPTTAFASARDLHSARRAVVELQSKRLVWERSRGDVTVLDLVHDRLRETILTRVDPSVLRIRHATLARVLEGTASPDASVLCEQFRGAGDRSKASMYAERAGDQAADALAFARAAKLYEAALDSADGEPSRGRSLQLRRAEALANGGYGGDAASLFLELAGGEPTPSTSQLRRRAMEHYLISGRVRQGEDVLKSLTDALGLPNPKTPRRAFVGALGLMGTLRLRGIDVRPQAPATTPIAALQMEACFSAAKGLIGSDAIRGTYFGFKALTLALGAGDAERAAKYMAFVGAGVLAAAGGSFERWGHSMLGRARVIAEARADPALHGLLLVCQAQADILRGAWRDALSASEQAEPILRDQCVGATWERNFSQMGALRAMEELGRFADARVYVERFLHEARETGDAYADVTARLNRALLIHLADDRPEEARAEADRALRVWSYPGYHVQHLYALRIDIFCDLYQGNPAAAWERLESHWSAIKRSFLLRVPTGRIDVRLMRARVALALAARNPARRAQLLRECRKDIHSLRKETRPDASAHAAMLMGAVEALSGRPEIAVDHLRDAELRFDQLGMSLCRAYAANRIAIITKAKDRGAESTFRNALITNPIRWLSIHAPGYAGE